MRNSRLTDNYGRPLTYLRLAVTDRCNLRCFYCMPEQGINFLEKSQLLTYEEMERLVSILAQMGISKIRITGGEPLVRKDIVPFMKRISQIEGIESLGITTNGTHVEPFLDQFMEMGLNSINLSLDSLDAERFFSITRRNDFEKVWASYTSMYERGFSIKINMVVMERHNLPDIIPMCSLTKTDKVNIRFIEEMPFNGGNKKYQPIKWNIRRILNHIEGHFGKLEKIEDPYGSTSYNYRIPGFSGTIGVIPAYTRLICNECGRIRITSQGMLKTCLYDNGVVDLRSVLRSGSTDQEIADTFLSAFSSREKDGFEAEKNAEKGKGSFESMATIGG